MTALERQGFLAGAAATTIVGASFAASAAITAYPFAFGMTARYLLAALVLSALLRFRLGAPSLRELALLAGVALLGSVAFNAAVIAAVDHAAPSTVGVIIGATPLVLALAGPLARREAPTRRLVVAGAVVVAGAAITEGLGHGSLVGVLLAVIALGCEACFSLLAAPVVTRLGAMRVSAWACWLGTLFFVALMPLGPALRAPDGDELAALLYLALPVTVGGFVGWYYAVNTLRVERAGLLVGLMPISAYLGGMVTGAEHPAVAPAAGALVVGCGVIFGMRAPQPRPTAVISEPT